MKKLFFCVLIVLALFSFGTAALAADDTGMWEYQTTDGGVMLTKYNGDQSDVYIPNKIEAGGEKLDVISIGSKLFDGCLINSATLGEGITTIGDNAFEGQTSLVCIVTPESLTTIGSNAFSGCTSFNSVILYDGVTSIGENAFSNCSKLTIYCNENTAGHTYAVNNNINYSILSVDATPQTYTIDGIEYYIQNGEAIAISFDGSSTEVVIPETVHGYPVTQLRGTFKRCSSLTSISLPNSLKKIDENEFYNCSNLVSVTIGDGTTSVGNSAFEYCRSLASVTIGDGVTSIGNSAFEECRSLTSVTIGDGVTSIGEYAFAFCYDLDDVNITDIAAWCKISFGDCYANPLYFAKKLYLNGNLITELTIPEGVTNINSYAFCNCSSITSITIPDSVTSIGADAFSSCGSLTSITIGNGVTYIGGDAFSFCGSLTSITIGNSVTNIESGAFVFCDSLDHVYITDVEAWCKISFGDMDSNPLCYASNLYLNGNLLTELTIPEGVTSIGECAFYALDNLTSVTIPDGVTSIGNNAFSCCSSLTSVTIPDSVTSIGEGAFWGCTGLLFVTIPENLSNIDPSSFPINTILGVYENSYAYILAVENNLLYFIIEGNLVPEVHKYDGVTYFIMNGEAVANSFDNSVPNLIIPNEINACPVTHIGKVFYNSTALVSITLPKNIKAIDNSAFAGCSSLTSVTIPNSVTSIGDYAFCNCDSLTSVTIPNSVTSIGSKAFSYCDSLTNVTILNSVTSIGESAFYNCGSLTCVTIPDSVTSIGESAFYGCSSLTSITISAGVTSIEDFTFYNCSSLTSVTTPGIVTSIGSSAFDGCNSLLFAVIPESVNKLETSSFPQNTILCVYENSYAHTFALNNNRPYYITDGNTQPEVHIIDDVTYLLLNNEAIVVSFDNTATSITIPDKVAGRSVTSIRDRAFYDCSSLANVTIPDSLTSIGSEAFYGCKSLTSVTIPDSVTSIGESTFSYCDSLASVTIPDSVTAIEDYAFYHCSSLTNITIPDSVTTIEDYAFYHCSSLTNITIPHSVTSIGDSAFSNCYSLTSITIPDSVTSIGSYAFNDCFGLDNVYITDIAAWCKISFGARYGECYANPLYFAKKLYLNGNPITELIIPDSVTSIGSYAFYDYSGLTSVTISDSVTSIGSSAFSNCNSLTSITIPDSVTSIGGGAFAECSSLTSVTIPESVTSIGNSAFSGCDSLTSVTIPKSVTSIGSYAFSYCDNLVSVTVDNGVTSIGKDAFSYCDSLTSVTIPDSVTNIDSKAFADTAIKTVTIPESVTSLKVDSFPANTILCVYKDSYAHKFAVENDLLYFIIRKTGNPEISFGTSVTGTVTYTDGSASSGVAVEILYDDGTVKESVVTDAQGNYEFAYAEVGRYTIKATDSSGNTASEVVVVKRMNVFDVYLAGETELVLKKGYSISGNVSPETATLILTDTDRNVIESITTTNGNFVFENITNGSYILRAETENGIAVREITLFNSDVVLEDIIIEAQGATVTGCVEVSDRENNLYRRGWVQVTIYNSDGTAVGSVKSDSEGRYTFTKLPLGEYSIVAETTEIRPDKKKHFDRSHTLTGYGYVNITEAATYTVNITLYEERDHLATITGKVTAHGEHQACEVILTNVFRHEIAKYETGKNGKYTFKNVRDGVYFITAITESDGMGFAVVVVRDGRVYGETDITVYKHDRITEHENKMHEIPHCAGRDDALKHKDRIAEEKRFYDSLSEKEKKQLSKSYRERLNKLCEWIADCEYTENGGTLDRGGMIISGDELEGEKEVRITLNISPRSAHEIGDEGIQTEADFIQQSIEDTAGHRTLAVYYDITLTKTVDGVEQNIKNIAKNTDTTGKVRITMPIPDEYKGHKKYTFVHVHNGIATTLADLDNNPDTITFEVDRFSTFALCYSDEDERPYTAEIEYSADSGEILVSAAEDATLYVITFESGKLTGVQAYNITANAESQSYVFAETQKAFIFDADMIPLCESFSL